MLGIWHEKFFHPGHCILFRMCSLKTAVTIIIVITFRCPSHSYTQNRGTGMIASSSTFCPHPGRVIRDLLRQLHAAWHGTEALVYSNNPREAAASSYLAIIFGHIASGVSWVLRSTAVLMQLSHQCWCMLW